MLEEERDRKYIRRSNDTISSSVRKETEIQIQKDLMTSNQMSSKRSTAWHTVAKLNRITKISIPGTEDTLK